MSTIKNIKHAGNQAPVTKRPNKKSSADPPPAYFLSVELQNVRCFGTRQTLDLSDGNGRPAQWTVILGENGVGKTTLLQCIAAFEASRPPFESDAKDMVIPKLAWQTKELTWKPLRFPNDDVLRDVIANYQSPTSMSLSCKIHYGSRLSDGGMGKIFDKFNFTLTPNAGSYRGGKYTEIGGLACYGYGASRRTGKGALSNENGTYASASLFDEDVSLVNAEEWLLATDYAASKPSSIQKRSEEWRDRVKSLLIDMLPDVEDISISAFTENHPAPGVRIKTPYGWVSIRDLSLGYKTLIAWMVDLAPRLFERYPDSPDPLAEPAIVLVDEIDLHLHPKWQRELISYLSKKFVNTQFIVTAHSPLVVQSATNANIVLLRREGDHVVIDNDVESVRNFRIDQILTSDLYGLPSARPPELDELMAKRNQLLSKGKFTKQDEKELHKLEAQIGPLPTGETPRDIKAMDILRRAAERLKE